MTDMGYNTANENANDEWKKSLNGEEISGEVVERIDRSNLVQLTKPECKHKNVTRSVATEFDIPVTEISCNDCPIGWFEKAQVNRG